MSQFSWAYVNCSDRDVDQAAGPTGSLQYLTGTNATSGSANLIFNTSSNSLILTGTLVVTGTISASHYTIKDIAVIDATGSTIFGNSTDDTHQRTGSMFIQRPATTGGAPLEVLRLSLEDEGVDMNVGEGPALTFYVGETSGKEHGGTIAVVKEAAPDADGAASMIFRTGIDDTAPTERMRITSAGKVGIGTTSPSAVLSVSGALNIAGTILPGADNTYDLGNAVRRWQNVYTTDLHLRNDRGDWTLIEEEDYLTVRNNKTGKKYKLLMEEID
jgi:hypothetical protein